MASRWRTWDKEFFIDGISSKKPEETEVIPAVGRGRGKLSKDVASLTLPKAALGIKEEKKGAQVTGAGGQAAGRGRASVIKARALTSSPPVRRPGEKPATVNRLESFPPLSAAVNRTRSNPPSPKCVKESSKDRSSWPKPTASASSGGNPPGIPGIHPQEEISSSSDSSNVLIIENLPSDIIAEKDLVELFKPYGDVLTCIIERDWEGNHLGTAIVRMESRSACEWIINTFTGEQYPGARGPMVCRYLTE